jgi:hypothetical protein
MDQNLPQRASAAKAVPCQDLDGRKKAGLNHRLGAHLKPAREVAAVVGRGRESRDLAQPFFSGNP